MLPRFLRASIAAVRNFSADAAAVRAKPASTSDGLTSGKNVNNGVRDTLCRRILGLVYTKRSAVIAINKWKEEGRKVQKYQLNHVVRELRKFKRYKHALEVCEWMQIQKDLKLLPGDYAVHLDLIAKIRGVNSAEKFFEDLPDNKKDYTTCSALLHTYTQHKESVKAEALFAKMSELGFLKHPLPYNHMLNLYISTGQMEKVPDVIQALKRNASPDVVTYNLWLSVCASRNDVELAEKVFLELQKEKIDPDWLTYSTLANLYIKNSLRKKAASTLGEMEKRVSKKVRGAYSSLISLHASLGNKDEVYFIWKKMKTLFRKLNDSEYMCMIASLVKLEEFKKAKELYKEWRTVSPTGDTRVPNIILAAYINGNQMEKAEKFHNQMVEDGFTSSYTTWELLTWAYLKQKQVDKVLHCFTKAIGSVKKWNFDEKMVRKIFEVLEENGDIEGAEKLLVTVRRSGNLNTDIYNSVLRTYAKAGKMPLVIAERMKTDGVDLNEETQQLLKLTSKMCISEVPSSFTLFFLMADENGNVDNLAGFLEDGMPWLLPTDVLDELLPTPCDQNKLADNQKHRQRQPKRLHSRPPLTAAVAAEPPHPHPGWDSSQPRPQRTRNGTNTKVTVGGPGMQVVFLDSGKPRSGGTGVFLPRRAGTEFQPSNKPACPPVLLPARVVQALNLNVHKLCSQPQKPRQESVGKKSKGGGGGGNGNAGNLLKVKNNDNSNDEPLREVEKQWSSPEAFLPKEWTY
ncbi:OLC1v1007327C1 [Oldenlandia corymbosa var. corymbosa]|uniref:OLC1v1007327C1 n=1 Tax=Oldenlandia corymbosa var. corymbosa TaxID=529605 RepID=A0AAV1DLD2_OLDCO|nr:OLC1v1007327C1 [Oldenlandia corymbosa var. corymbosa]